MKNRKNLVTVLGLAVLLFAACMIPTFVTALEDKHLQSENKRYEIEEIKLGSKKEDLTEKLSAMQEALTDYVVVQKNNAETDQSQREVERKVKEYLSMLSNNIMINDDATEPEFPVFSAVQIMIADPNIGKVYSLWKCDAISKDGDEYLFWIDKETEKVLAFDIPFYFVGKDLEGLYKMTEKMAEYYGFAGAELTNEAKSFLKQSYAVETLYFIDKKQGTEIPLLLYKNEDRLNFNMHSRAIDIYDSATYSY